MDATLGQRGSGTRGLALRAGVLTAVLACADAPSEFEREIQPVVEDRFPHDSEAFTQGLLFAEGTLYESTGLYGNSSLRQVDVQSGEVLRIRHLDSDLFGEGLALVDDRLIQLTWQAGVAYVYERETFEEVSTFSYEGEGWGLCYDGQALWMSDGSSTLTVRDPQSFDIQREVEVRQNGERLDNLNELACVGYIYANVWFSDEIVAIDKESGDVEFVIDASSLLTEEEAGFLPSEAVLNGIAYNPDADLFYLTGKWWPSLFAVRLER